MTRTAKLALVTALLATLPYRAWAQGQAPAVSALVGPPRAMATKTPLEPLSASLGVTLPDPAPAVVLDSMDVRSLMKQDLADSSRDLRLRIGVNREIVVRGRDGRWLEVPGRGWLWLADVVSKGALATRLHFDAFQLPESGQVVVYSPSRKEEVLGPFEKRGPNGDAQFWSPPVSGSQVRIECFVPGAAPPSQDPFLIDQVIHNYRDLVSASGELRALEGSCHLDVMCYPDWIALSHAVARIDFVSGGAGYLCSGQLLNTFANDLTPYFLTANHCISTQSEASTARIAWLYQTSTCNGTPPSYDSVPKSDGCTLLSTGTASDYTLLMVDGALPGGLTWSGWDTGVVGWGTAVVGIHHPGGAYKRISFGSKTIFAPCGGPLGADHSGVQWGAGTAEPGSSGSGLFRGDNQLLVGQLHCGVLPIGCSNPTGWFSYGDFGTTYPNISTFLNGGSDDALEDNDVCTAARTMTAGNYANLIVKLNDPDWYQIILTNNATLTAHASFQNANGDIDLKLYDSCSGPPVASSTGSSDLETIVFTNTTGVSARYFLNVYLTSGTRNTYDLSLSVSGYPNLSVDGIPVGWSDVVVPRNTSGASDGSALVTPTLDGNTNDTWFNWACYLAGPGSVTNLQTRLLIDEGDYPYALNGTVPGTAAPGFYHWLNRGPNVVRGGRHSFTLVADPDNLIPESREDDNVLRGQWIWSPYVLTDQVPVIRAAPPPAGGFGSPNCDGFQFTAGWWGAVGILPTTVGDDYDLYLYDDYAGSATGFYLPLRVSEWGGTTSDFVLINGNVLGFGQTRWVGAVRPFTTGAGNAIVQQSNPVGATLAPETGYGTAVVTPTTTIAANDVLKVHEFYLGSTATIYTFSLENLSGTADLDMGLYSSTGDYFRKSDHLASSETVGGGLGESFDFRPASAGYYAVVVWKRDHHDAGLTNTYRLKVGPTATDLVASDVPPAWDAPAVPRNDGAAGASAVVSPTLDGNTPDTRYNWSVHEVAPNPTPGWQSRIYLDVDDPSYLSFAVPSGSSGDVYYRALDGSSHVVRGGRHSLTTYADFNNTVAESNEGNNSWTGQWVWSPLVTAKGVPVVRGQPPQPGDLALPNSDGMQFSHGSYAWVVGLAGRAGGDDYDLYLYDDYSSSTSGFSNLRASSEAGGDATDFVVGHFSGTPPTIYPSCVRPSSGSGSGPYTADQMDAQGRIAGGDGHALGQPASWVHQFMGVDRMVDVYEANLVAGHSYNFVLYRELGSADMAFEVFPGTVGGIYAHGGGTPSVAADVDEDDLTFTAAVSGWHPIVVYRSHGAEVGSNLKYTFAFSNATILAVGDRDSTGGPLQFYGPAPNPSRGNTRFAFQLPRSTRVELSVYDVGGRRVARLADREFAAGSSSVAWDGRGEDGAPVANGLYWSRLSVGGQQLVRRFTILR
jgi:hypothetical protein